MPPNSTVMCQLNKEELINVIKGWAANEPLVREAHLFGNRARSDFNKQSDVDVAVKIHKKPGDGSEYGTWLGYVDDLTNSLQAMLPYQLDLEWYHPTKTPHVRQYILQSSIKVYDEPVT